MASQEPKSSQPKTLTTVKPDLAKISLTYFDFGFEASYLDRAKKARYTKKETGTMSLTTTANGKPEEKDVRKVDFDYSGDKIVIPENMDLDEAYEAIGRQRDEENVTVSISEMINAFPMDGAVALMRVLKRRYGWTNLVPTQGFFGPRPPQMVGVDIGFGEKIQVPWGNMTVPKIEGTLSTGYTFKDGMPCFLISGNVKRKHERIVQQIANEVREEVRNASIYRGKAIKINFRDGDGERREFDASLCPRFIDMKTIGDTQPIFSKGIEDQIRINIINPIRYSKRCRDKGASLKKGIVLGGPYGTGKTLTAFQVAQICEQHGWTFLYLEDVRDLDLAIGFARLYGPCVLFAEDCDKMAMGPRTPEMDRILNTIDGVESKGDMALITVLTTNHLQIINPAFLRPGRIDAVINVTPPDEDACLRIVKKYVAEGGCKLSGTDDELKAAIQPLVGANAAFFRNTVEQAKLAAIENMASDDAEVVITAAELEVVAKGMVPHCKLINPEHGSKKLVDLTEEQQDPMTVAMAIVGQKFAEIILDNVTNPKMLSKIIMKPMKKMGGMGGGGSPLNN